MKLWREKRLPATTAPQTMTVWVLEVGCYSDLYIEGIYRTPQAAMAAWNLTDCWTYDAKSRSWDNGRDLSEGASITAYEVLS